MWFGGWRVGGVGGIIGCGHCDGIWDTRFDP